MKPEILVAGLIVTVIFAVLLARVDRRSRREKLETLAGIIAAFVGVFLVSAAPEDIRLPVVLGVVAVYFLAYVVLGYIRAGGPDDRSSR
jgi:hypothetical protein